MSHPLDPIFRPRSVAVIGASTAPEKYGHIILKNILDAGFPGPVYPVNPKATEILGRPCVSRIADLPFDVDLAVVIIPAAAVPQAVEECGQRGIRAAIVISGGFAERGEEGAALQRELVEAARRSGVRAVGPNCQGVNNPHHRLCASWPLLTLKGEIAILSQSGTVGAALMDWASEEALGCSAFVSLGNRSDVDESDLIDYFAQDSQTRVIAAYLEGVKDLDRFRQVVSQCAKPIVILKAGRTAEGRRAAESHTKSLAGRDELYSALFRRLRIHRADSLEDLYDAAKALAYLPRPAGRRILMVTSSGGSAILATDWAEWSGLTIAPLPEPVADSLRALLPAHYIVGNPLDLTGDATAALYRTVLDATASHYDYQIIIFGDPILGASEAATPGRPQLAIFLGGADVERQERERLHRKKVPVFPTPERGIRALARLYAFEAAPPAALPSALTGQGRWLAEPEALQLLVSYGLPVIPHRLVTSAEEAARAARELGFPVALKVVAPEIVHKSDVGGVILNVSAPEDARAAFMAIMDQAQRGAPLASIRGILVASMAARGTEAIVGMIRDAQFGPAVMFGLGGTFVELYRDVSFRLPPLSLPEARAMLLEVKAAAVLTGYRGQPPRDLEALASCLCTVARIAAEHPEIQAIDLNPVIAYEHGCVIVDAKIQVQ